MTLSLAVMALLVQCNILLAFFASSAHCTLTLNLLPTRNSRLLATELLPSQVGPSLCCSPPLYYLRCKTLHLSILNFIGFLSVHSLSLQGGAPFPNVHFPTQFSISGKLVILSASSLYSLRWILSGPTCRGFKFL